MCAFVVTPYQPKFKKESEGPESIPYVDKPLSFENGMLTYHIDGRRYVLVADEGLKIFTGRRYEVDVTDKDIATFLLAVIQTGNGKMKKFTAAHIRVTKRQRAK